MLSYFQDKAATDPDYEVSLADVQAWEDRNGPIPDGAIVIMNSGWHKKYPNTTLIFNNKNLSDVTNFHFPGWHGDTIKWIIQNRNINMAGVDTPSTDYGFAQVYPVHIALAERNIPGLENVANLDNIPESGTTIYVGLIKLKDGSGTPVRVYATISNMASLPGIFWLELVLLETTAITAFGKF